MGGAGAPVLSDWSLELAPSTCVAQVVARVTASAPTVAPGQNVTFDASDSTAPDPAATLTYAWKVDDVDVPGATGPQLVRSWPAKGRHRVSVTVSDGSGDATDEADVAVTVPPVPALAALPAGLRSFDGVTLDASGSSDPDGSVATYAWDLDGDGRYDHTDTSPTWSTLAPTAGTYTVRLKVTDDLGASAVTTRPLTVVNRPPTAALTGPQPAIPRRGGDVRRERLGRPRRARHDIRLDLRRRRDRHDHHADHHARLRGQRHAHGEGEGHRRRRRDRGGHAAAR